MNREQNKIIISGKGQIAVRSLSFCWDLLTLAGYSSRLVALAVTSDRGEDSWQPSLRKVCRSQNIECYQELNEIDFSSEDVFFSLEYDRIIKLKQLNGCRAFNIHFSLLPKYRGCHTSVWPIRNGETRSGVTLHKIDQGVDSGPIVDQISFEIPSFFTAQQLYEAYNNHGFQLFKRNLFNILRNEETYCGQDPQSATYFSRASIDYSNDVHAVDFSEPAPWVCDYLRSLIFPVFQCPIFRNRRVFHAEIVDGARRQDVPPGTILKENSDRALVVCGDGQVVRMHFHPVE